MWVWMKRSWRDEIKFRLCIPIVEETIDKATKSIDEANRLADLIELRMDYLKEPNLWKLFLRREKPLIVTNRWRKEGGRFEGDEKKRLSILMEAIDMGADYIDVEMESKGIKSFIKKKEKTSLILSWHDFKRTPSLKELRNLLEEMIRRGADIAKIVTLARSFEDNLKLLSLIPYGKERRLKTIAFCMGDRGRMSRIFAPLFGAPWTYASLNKAKRSAPGQLMVREIKEFWQHLI